MKYWSQGNFVYGLIYLLIRGMKKIKTLLSTFFYRSVMKSCGVNVTFGADTYIDNINNIKVGNNCKIGAHCTLISEKANGLLTISDNVQISDYIEVDYSGNVYIGEDSLLSSKVRIFTHDHGYNPHSVPEYFSLHIGKNVWIGYGAIILPKTKMIGDNSVIAAGAVVTKPVQAGTIIGGNPARVIRMINDGVITHDQA